MPITRSKRYSKKSSSRSGSRSPSDQEPQPVITRSKRYSKKSSSRSGSRSPSDQEPQPVRGSSPRAGTGTTSPRAGTGTTSQSFKPRRSSSRRSVPPERFSILDSISPERKMDILGVGMAIVGLLTLLSLFSANKSGLTSGWISMLAQVFGWGVYILPVGLIVLGTWLVARNVDRLPALNIERVIGILLLFVGLLVTFHG
ncbi:MAG: hypothetical protein NTW99_02510, partial [Chloroflexi bacterium]|nr:hypothetical protein [Chloroflexota bacterium]